MVLLIKKVDITGGPIVKSIIAYAIPLMLGAFIQVGFNAADLMIVGQFGDSASIAAVGAVGPIVSFLVGSFLGISVGARVLLAKSLGQATTERTKTLVSTSILFALFFGIALMLGFFAFSEPLLSLVGCKEEYFDEAVAYMNLYAIGIPAMMVYNFSSAIINTTGDTQRPFIYLVIAGAMNVILNFILCFFMEHKAAAIAVATTASQFTGAILCFRRLLKLKGECGFDIKHISFSWKELGGIIRIGAPCAFKASLFSLSNLQMSAAINSYGTAATAGNAASANLETIANAFYTGFTTATVPFVGQNLGAGNRDRVKKSILACITIGTGIALVTSFTVYAFGEQLLKLYLPTDPVAVEFALSRMKLVLIFSALHVLTDVTVGAMHAFGYSLTPTINSIVTVLAFRVLWLEVIYPRLDAINHTIENVYLCYPVSYTLSLIANFTLFLIIWTKYKKGKLKQN